MTIFSLYDEEKVKLPDASRWIRLLKLERQVEPQAPSIHDTNVPPLIHCTLLPVDLAAGPRFHALSYTWVDPLGKRPYTDTEHPVSHTEYTIYVNGRPLEVLENLYNALMMLASRSDPVEETLYWVDAISIDQGNATEKQLQVPLMGELYSLAQSVIVWLGEKDTHAHTATEMIRHIGQMQPHEYAMIQAHTIGSPRLQHLLPEDLNQKDSMKALAHFFARSYFGRCWIMQEIILAQKIVVYCGDIEISWNHLRTTSGHLSKWWQQGLRTASFDPGLALYLGGAAKLGSTREHIARMSTPLGGRGISQDLFVNTLIRARDFSCKYPKDKVYSCYGIAHQHILDSHHLPAANYSPEVSIEQVFTETARAILQTSGDLHILAYAESLGMTGKSMPSWVPDWTIEAKVGFGITGYKRYWAARDLTQSVELNDSATQLLVLQGRRLCYVAHVGNTKQEMHGGCFDMTREALSYAIANRLDSLDCKEIQTTALKEELWRTLIADTDSAGCTPADARLGRSFESWLTSIDLTSHITGLLREYRQPCHLTLRETDLDSADITGFDYDVSYSLRSCLKLFCTDTGCLGIGAEALQVGDAIWIIPGSRVPLIMRHLEQSPYETATRCRLVGAAYVHGFMHGEALKEEFTVSLDTVHIE